MWRIGQIRLMARKTQKIKRGEIWVADLNPGYGVEIHKIRPVVIISNDLINYHSLRLVVLPFTSQIHPLDPGKVLLKAGEYSLKKQSAVLVSDIRSIDKSRLREKIETLSEEKMEEVKESLKLVLGLKEI